MIDVMEYYGLVIYTAREVQGWLQSAGIDIAVDDLVQEGAVGLLEAVQRFDAERGIKICHVCAAACKMEVIDGWDERFERRIEGPEQASKKVSYFIPKKGERLLAVLATASEPVAKQTMLHQD
tara:strand:+ start:97 stop:465 length:369 start_codon:yes stop_codon:yes gene_type:complete